MQAFCMSGISLILPCSSHASLMTVCLQRSTGRINRSEDSGKNARRRGERTPHRKPAGWEPLEQVNYDIYHAYLRELW